MRARRLLVLAAFAAVGCGGDEDRPEAPARAEAADPPRGWRTVRNDVAGFTVAAPRRWSARTRRGATLVRSPDRLVAVTFAADRSRAGAGTPPADYARDVIAALPGFEGAVSVRAQKVRGSPYPSAIAQGDGTVSTSGRAQSITVAAFHQPGEATYSAVIFRNARVRPPPARKTLRRMLATFRAGRAGD
jgi:hypothetical protein